MLIVQAPALLLIITVIVISEMHISIIMDALELKH